MNLNEAIMWLMRRREWSMIRDGESWTLKAWIPDNEFPNESSLLVFKGTSDDPVTAFTGLVSMAHGLEATR